MISIHLYGKVLFIIRNSLYYCQQYQYVVLSAT